MKSLVNPRPEQSQEQVTPAETKKTLFSGLKDKLVKLRGEVVVDEQTGETAADIDLKLAAKAAMDEEIAQQAQAVKDFEAQQASVDEEFYSQFSDGELTEAQKEKIAMLEKMHDTAAKNLLGSSATNPTESPDDIAGA